MPFQIIRNDITKVRADAIVNTANPEPVYAGGTDFAVYRAAGEKELLEERKKIGHIGPGEAAVTPAFRLSAKYIIHTVGPAWIDGQHGEFEILASCYRKSLLLARQLNCQSIAFPLISTGVYGFPKDRALDIALEQISAFMQDSDMDVTLVVFDRKAFDLSSSLEEEVRQYIDENYVEKQREEEYSIDNNPSTGSRIRRRNANLARRRTQRAQEDWLQDGALSGGMPQGYGQQSGRPQDAASFGGMPFDGMAQGYDLQDDASFDGTAFNGMAQSGASQSGVSHGGRPKKSDASEKKASRREKKKTGRGFPGGLFGRKKKDILDEDFLPDARESGGKDLREEKAGAYTYCEEQPYPEEYSMDISESETAAYFFEEMPAPEKPDRDIAGGVSWIPGEGTVGAGLPASKREELRIESVSSQKPRSLQELMAHVGETFQERLLRLIDERGLSDSQVYKRANIDRKHFSKIRCNADYIPRRRTVIALAIALQLNMDETTDLLRSAGMALSPGSRFDLIISFCIQNEIYDTFKINALLFDYDQPLLGA